MKELIEEVKKELKKKDKAIWEVAHKMNKNETSISRMLSGRHSIQLQNFINLAKCAGLKIVLVNSEYDCKQPYEEKT